MVDIFSIINALSSVLHDSDESSAYSVLPPSASCDICDIESPWAACDCSFTGANQLSRIGTLEIVRNLDTKLYNMRSFAFKASQFFLLFKMLKWLEQCFILNDLCLKRSIDFNNYSEVAVQIHSEFASKHSIAARTCIVLISLCI